MESEDRSHSADYVEARGILLPATDYLKRAVDAGMSSHTLYDLVSNICSSRAGYLGGITVVTGKVCIQPACNPDVYIYPRRLKRS